MESSPWRHPARRWRRGTLRGHLAVDDGNADARLLEHVAILKDAGDAAAGAGPGVLWNFGHRAPDRGADLVLRGADHLEASAHGVGVVLAALEEGEGASSSATSRSMPTAFTDALREARAVTLAERPRGKPLARAESRGIEVGGERRNRQRVVDGIARGRGISAGRKCLGRPRLDGRRAETRAPARRAHGRHGEHSGSHLDLSVSRVGSTSRRWVVRA